MKKFIMILLVFGAQAQASGRSVALSKTATILVPNEFKSPYYSPSLSFYVSSGLHENTNHDVLIKHSSPPVFVNLKSVQEYWDENKKITSQVSKTIKDNNCRKIDKFNIECSRLIRVGERFVYEKIHWNGKWDLIYIRLTNSKSRLEAEKAAENFSISTRLPASVKKKVNKK